MKIAVLSDCHDHLENLALAMALVRESGAARLFYLGDFCAPFTLAALAEGFSGPVDAVIGNNDGDVAKLSRTCDFMPSHPRSNEVRIVSLVEPCVRISISESVPDISVHCTPLMIVILSSCIAASNNKRINS